MKLLKIATGEAFEADIREIVNEDLKLIEESKEFEFDWYKEKYLNVYKIFLIEQQDNILGLISMVDFSEELRIHINLIEISSSNIGKGKTWDNIAGCLIAFACSLAFKKKYGGFVSLLPKTRLIYLYQEKYGFRQFGRLLAVQFAQSKSLIEKYIGDEDI
jgi:hypothetical protein